MLKKDNVLENKNAEQYPYVQLLDYGSKVITMLSALVGLAYAIGFVTTNMHLLTKYGIYDFEIIKTRYILTGFFFLILTYVAYVAGMGVLKATDRSSKTVAKILIGIVSTVLFAMSIGSIIKGVIGWVVQSYSELATIATFIRIWSLLAISAVVATVHFIRAGGWKQHGINISVPYSIFTSTLVVVGAYSQLVYPVLPIALGGGSPVPIQMIIEDDKAKLIGAAIPFVDEATTEKIYLIDQSSSSYFVLIHSSDGIHRHAVEIRKDYVVSVVHLMETIIPPNTDTPIPVVNATSSPTAQANPIP